MDAIMAMVRSCGSRPAPMSPLPVDRPDSSSGRARGPVDDVADERQELPPSPPPPPPPLDVGARTDSSSGGSSNTLGAPANISGSRGVTGTTAAVAFDVMAMVRNRGSSKPVEPPPPPPPCSAPVADRSHGKRAREAADDAVDEQQQPQQPPSLDVGAKTGSSTLGAPAAAINSGNSSSSGGGFPAVAFDVVAMVRNRGSDSVPPPLRSAPVVADRPHGDRARGEDADDVDEGQELQPPLLDAGATRVDDTPGAPASSGSSSSGGGFPAAVAFDVVSMVRNRGSKPVMPLSPTSPPPLRSAPVVADRPHGGSARGFAGNVADERQELPPQSSLDAGARPDNTNTPGAPATESS
ncbi:unnamed protein product, partial [Laminaria digitata]